LLIGTRSGKSIRFDESQVRSMGRNSAGVKGIELDDDDRVVGMAVSDPQRSEVLAICERGYGKRTPLEEFRQQKRGGKGIILIDASERNGPVVGIAMVRPEDDLVLMTDQGQTLRTSTEQVRSTGRNAQGVRVMNVAENERVVAIETIEEREDTGDSIAPPSGAEGESDAPPAVGAHDGDADDSVDSSAADSRDVDPNDADSDSDDSE
jgi:DNA gyrase subunit A